jgi:glycosyltransferase involved in cell wall biosynthesis
MLEEFYWRILHLQSLCLLLENNFWMKTLTVFTPTFNRKHTIYRTYESLCRQTSHDFEWLIIDDGSIDNTREWVMGLGEIIIFEGESFDWMGRPLSLIDSSHFVVLSKDTVSGFPLRIEYIYKPNGGLYTGYNTAYANIQTELCVCIDSDDFMPDNAVEKIINLWANKGSDRYCGILGLDFDIHTKKPIGGFFPNDLKEGNMLEIESKHLHSGDTKQVMRTDLMKKVAPMVGFRGEKNFNPFYMLMQVCDEYPMLIYNDNLCTVEYQVGTDSMSQGIYMQYINSPKSYAKYRAKTMELSHISLKRKMMLAAHYVSSCLIAKDKEWLSKTPFPLLTLLMSPFGVLLYFYILNKTRS